MIATGLRALQLKGKHLLWCIENILWMPCSPCNEGVRAQRFFFVDFFVVLFAAGRVASL
jgi:hypothetical protein